ncbi:hypothetical protein C1701_23735 [Actinoalloteichus sp. AHMU CJ021]|nr:hypothetical protein C1701_23735 [Actinoalloteichus sp. AHMU CJ021]
MGGTFGTSLGGMEEQDVPVEDPGGVRPGHGLVVLDDRGDQVEFVLGEVPDVAQGLPQLVGRECRDGSVVGIGVEQGQRRHLVALPLKLDCDLVGEDTTEGPAQQVVWAVGLVGLDLTPVVSGQFDEGAGGLEDCRTLVPGLQGTHRPVAVQVRNQRRVQRAGPAGRVHADQGRGAAPGAEW